MGSETKQAAIMTRTVKTHVGFTYAKGSKVWAYKCDDFWVIERWKWIGDKYSRINNVCVDVPRRSFCLARAANLPSNHKADVSGVERESAIPSAPPQTKKKEEK